MSGRGKGHSKGQGSNFSGRGNSSTNSGGNKVPMYKPSKKTLSDYIYYVGSAKQAVDYEKTTEFLINYIKKTFNFGSDIGTALESLEAYDMDKHKPTLECSKNTNEDVKTAENRQYEIEFKAEFDAYMKLKQSLEMNTSKAYAFLWEQCAKAMQNKIESSPKYETIIKGNPIELLKAIKQHALNYQEHRYEMSIIFDALRTMINLKQKENESIQDYTKRFKTAQNL
jgi:hypothetical protein